MEKRAYTRQSVDFEVILSCHAIKDQRCRVKDFCIGGMLLSWAQKDVSRNPNLTTLIRNDSLSITIDVPSSSGENKQYTLSAKAARIDGTNMGISFIHPDTNALASIQQLAKISGQSNQSKPSISNINHDINPSVPHFNNEAKKRARSKYSETQERQILKQNLDIINNFFDDKITDYFKELNEQLQASIENAKDNAEQNELFDNINKFKKSLKNAEDHIKRNISQPFSDYSLKNKFDLSHLRKDNASNKIGLIDKEEFEDWLVVKVMATKIESSNSDALLELQMRYGELSGLLQGIQNNPISPAVVCDAFNSVMTALPINIKLRKIIYRLFEQKVALTLNELYKKLNTQLDSAGILKDFDIVDHLGQIKQVSGTPKPTKSAPSVAKDDSQPSDIQNSSSTTQGHQHSNSANAGASVNGATNTNNQNFNHINDLQALENTPHLSNEALKNQLQQDSQPVNSSARQFDVQQRIARNAADTVKRLIHNHHNQAKALHIYQTDTDMPVIERQVFSKKLKELQVQEPTTNENTTRINELI